jgi:hypothetical protein
VGVVLQKKQGADVQLSESKHSDLRVSSNQLLRSSVFPDVVDEVLAVVRVGGVSFPRVIFSVFLGISKSNTGLEIVIYLETTLEVPLVPVKDSVLVLKKRVCIDMRVPEDLIAPYGRPTPSEMRRYVRLAVTRESDVPVGFI